MTPPTPPPAKGLERLLIVALFALPMALMWLLLTNRLAVDSFLLGLVIGFLVLWANDFYPRQLCWRRLPGQFWALMIYTVILGRDIVLSSVDVARRVLSPELPCAPGIIALTPDVAAGDIAGLSAHAISITPGELVVDFATVPGATADPVPSAHRLFVHVLDVHGSTAEKLRHDQTQRERLLGQILGRDPS